MHDKIIKYRRFILITAISVTFLSFLLFPQLNINPNLDDYVPDYIENQIYLRKMDSIFGGSELILVLLKSENVLNKTTLNRVQALADNFSALDGIDRCITPFDAKEINYSDGFMSMDAVLSDLPKLLNNQEELKTKILNNKMASNFFSDDFSYVSVILTKNSEASDLIIDSIQNTILLTPGDEEVIIGGFPYIRYSISGSIKDDLIILVPLALTLMVLMLYFSFREWKGVLLPFLIVIMSIILSFGIMALLGWQISLITILMPIMLIAIANDYGIHMIARYQELSRSSLNHSMHHICKRIYLELRRPIVITGLTTIGGVLGLLTHTMIPAAQLGVLTAIGIAFALLLSTWFLPAFLSYLKIPKKVSKSAANKTTPLDKWLYRLSKWVAYHPKRIVSISLITAIIGALGIFLLKIDTNVEGYFLGKSEVRKSTNIISKEFGGTQFISIVFSKDVISPETLKRMEAYEHELSTESLISTINSPVTLIKELSKGFYYPDEKGYNQIPETEDEVYQFLEIFAMGGNEEAIEQFIDYNYEYARILVSLADGTNSTGKYILNKLRELTADDPSVELITGPSLTKIELAEMVVNGQIKSLVFAMFVVFILLSFVFRSPAAGILSSVPLSIAILVLFGLMGFMGISVDIATALLSSIMIGVGVDYTIHFLWRFKVEHHKGLNYHEAVRETLSTAGRGIIINALSVIIGFSALAFSNFAPLRFFSALIVISITICLVSALLLVPGIIVLTRPKFLEK